MGKSLKLRREMYYLSKHALTVFVCLSLIVSTFLFDIRSVHASGTTYYVDSSITDTHVGSATPDCTTYDPVAFTCGGGSASVYATVADINAGSFSPDDQILFRKGQTWREELTVPSSGTSGHPIVFGAFGSGAQPIITGSDLITVGWSRDSANIWKSTVATQPNIVYFNGTRGTLMSAKASIVAEYEWYWAANVLYVWSPTDTDPSLHYTSPGIEAGSRGRVLQTVNNTYITVDGLTIRDGNDPTDNVVNVGTATVTGIIFQNCTVERGAAVGFDLKGFTTATDIKINNCTIQNNGGWGIEVETPYSSGIFSNNTITGNGWASIRDAQEYSGIEGQLGNINIFGNSVFANAPVCQFTDAECHGIYVDASPTTTNIYQNKIYGNSFGDGIKVRGSANIYQNTIYDNYGSGVEVGGNGTNNITVSIYDNLIYNNNSSSNVTDGLFEGSKGSGTLALSVKNNTLYGNAGTCCEEFDILDNLTSLSVLNNILFASPTRRTTFLATQSGMVSIDNNIQWRADGNPSIRFNGSDETWAQWQALGYDTHGLNVDPKFTNSSGSDFTLQSGSPAVDAGANLGSTFQLGLSPLSVWPLSVLTLNQNNYGTGWDIGAYVYTDTTAPTVSLTAPGNSSTISGSSVSLSATAGDNTAVAGVQFKLDTNTNIGTEVTASPYTTTWDSTSITNGSHTLIAVARDTYGNYATSSPVAVTVQNVVQNITSYPGGSSHVAIYSSVPSNLSTVSSTQIAKSAPTISSLVLTTNRELWDRGEDIRTLQKWFNANGFIVASIGPGSPGNETSIFGTNTYRVLIRFQGTMGLPQTGYLGPMTRQVLAQL